MQSFVLAGLLALCGVSLAVGIKLLLLARRTRGFPELALGVFFLLGGGIGYPLSAASALAGRWGTLLAALSSLFTGTSLAMLYVFTARVFHRGHGWARGVTRLAVAFCLIYCLGYATSQITATTPDERLRSTLLWGGVSLVLSGGAYSWTSFESLRHYAMYRRRLALGLADPAVVDRMLLWGLMGAATVLVVVLDAILLYTASAPVRETAIPLITCGGGLVVGLLLTLAFFPPPRYLAAVRRRAARSGVSPTR
jgi:hypothetical protein